SDLEADVLDEAEVEHAVGLVQHAHLAGVQRHDLVLLDVVDQPAGGGDDDVGAALQLLALLVVVDAAVDQRELQAEVGRELHRVLVDLDRQFAGRRQDQRARILGLALGQRRAGQQAVDHRDQERQGLAGAGLGLAGDVAALQRNRQGHGLDRGAAGEAGAFQPGEQRRMQVEGGKREVGQGLVGHGGSPMGSGPAALPGGLREQGAAAQTAGKVPGLVVPGTAPRLRMACNARDATPSVYHSPAWRRLRAIPPHPEFPMSDTVLHATDADFDTQVLASDQPVLVDFWAPWCGPCKMIAPALEQLAGEYAGKAKVVKVDVDQNQQTAMKYHVRSIPMLLLFKGGQVQATQIGAVGKAQLAQMIDKSL